MSLCFTACDADELNKTASRINQVAHDAAPRQAKGLFKNDLGKVNKRSSRSSSGLSASIQRYYREAERSVQSWFSTLFRNRNFRTNRSTNPRRRHSPKSR